MNLQKKQNKKNHNLFLKNQRQKKNTKKLKKQIPQLYKKKMISIKKSRHLKKRYLKIESEQKNMTMI